MLKFIGAVFEWFFRGIFVWMVLFYGFMGLAPSSWGWAQGYVSFGIIFAWLAWGAGLLVYRGIIHFRREEHRLRDSPEPPSFF